MTQYPVPAPAAAPTVSAIFRGFSQVFLVNSPWAGMLILIALAVGDFGVAFAATIGVLVEMLVSWRFVPEDALADGFMGFNGALVGVITVTFLGSNFLAGVVTIAGAIAVVVVHLLLLTVVPDWMPPLMAPSCVVGTALFYIINPDLGDIGDTAWWFGPLTSLSEVVFIHDYIPGALLLLALFIGSWQIGLFALLGGIIGTGFSWILFGPAEAGTGVWGYCAVLAAIALGGVMWSNRSYTWRLSGAILGALLAVVIRWAFATVDLPTFTWPYVIAVWIVAAIGKA